MKDLGQVLADFREEAAVLRANGHAGQAASIERVCGEVAAASTLFLEWIPEAKAMQRSGKGVDYFRTRYGAWCRDRLARMNGRSREYLACIVPTIPLASLIREEQRRAG